MKILYILSEYLPDSGGGIISHYARILPRLVERGHEVTVVLASKGKLDQSDYEIDGVRVQPLRAKFLEQYANRFGRWAELDIFYYLLPVGWAAWAQAQENFDYDVVEVTDWALLFLPWIAAEKRVPVVVSLHGSCGQVDWFGKCEPRSLDGDFVRLAEAAALRVADVVHANSRANADFWREKTGREIRVIPPAYGGRVAADGGGLIAEREERSFEPRIAQICTDNSEAQGNAWASQAGAAFSNPFTSELARDSENTSLIRSADNPAGARIAPEDRLSEVADALHGPKISKIGDRNGGSDGGNQLAESAEFLEGQSQAGLQMGNQKNRALRAANDPAASWENSSFDLRQPLGASPGGPTSGCSSSRLPERSVVSISVISGNKNSVAPKAQALDSRRSTLDAPGLVVGRLQNWKGAEVLCKALRLAPEIEIEWVGGDTDWGSSGKEASEYLAANYPDVFGKKLHWLGRLDREKVAQKMQAAGFLVVPSLWDVFNLTVAEGLEAGLPVICSKAAGAEMLIEDGISGFLFDPAKPEELAAHLKQILEMSVVDRNEMEHKAQEAVKTHLNEEKILNLLEGSYRDAIKRGVTTSKEAWLESLLSAGSEQVAPPKLNLAKRAIRKAVRMLVDV